MTPTMDEAARRRFAGILGRLGSDHDGERAAAALLATRMLGSAGLTWQDVALPGEIAEPALAKPPPTAPDWRDDLDLCTRHVSRLNAWEQGFIKGLQPLLTISPKQRDTLCEIATVLRDAGLS